MSLYGNSVKTHIIDPVYNKANFRAEYRLEPDTLYYSQMRLINLGVEGVTGNKKLNGQVGCLGLIKQISLYDDNQLLDQQLEAARFLAFGEYNKRNDANRDMNCNLSKNAPGTMWGNMDAADADPAAAVGSKIDTWAVKPGVSGTVAGATRNSQAWFDLKKCFPLLNAVKVMNTHVFKKLKIVIEYSVDLDDFMQTTDDTGTVTYEAQLIVDEVIGEKEIAENKKFSTIQYTSIEHDRSSIPALTSDTVVNGADITADNQNPLQATTLHINGFNNKLVTNLLIVKSPTLVSNYKVTNDNKHSGKWASFTNNHETFQCRVNGASLFAGSGITRENQRLALLQDTYGVCSSYPFCNTEAYLEVDGGPADRDNYIGQGNYSIGSLDYIGFHVNDLVNDLQFDFSRRGVYSRMATPAVEADDVAASKLSPYNQRIDLNIYGEVFKEIVPTGSGYQVNYM